MGLTKGIRFANLRAFVTQRFGEGAWDALLDSLPAADAAAVRTVVAAGWFDHALRARLVRRLCARHGAAVAVELGRFEAQRDLTTVHRWFLRLVKPSFAIRNMNAYWCRSEDSGRWISEVNGDAVVARLYGWDPVEPALCHTLRGYLARTLELLGGGEITVEHVRCRAGGDPFCEFRTVFPQEEGGIRWSDPVIGADDVPAITAELAQLTDMNAVGEAVVAVLHRRIRLPYVALWVQAHPHGEPRLLRSIGRSDAGMRSFVLQAGGNVVGRLDVDAPRSEAQVQAIEQLVPCIGLALRSAGACSEGQRDRAPSSQPPSVDRRLERIAAAARRWKLTSKEREVLELVVQGQTNKEIAADLGCQEGTVEVHVSKALRKSGAGNRAGLVARVWSDR